MTRSSTYFASLVAISLGLAFALPAAAQSEANEPAAGGLGGGDPAEQGVWSGLSFSAGLFDIGQSEKATEFGVEYRLAARRFWIVELKPTFGVSGNDDGAFWVQVGFRTDFPLGERWVVTPNFATTYYNQGDSKDMGHDLEFRSGLEIAHKLRNGHRVGLCLYHLSNASISSHNPGEESLILTYSLGR